MYICWIELLQQKHSLGEMGKDKETPGDVRTSLPSVKTSAEYQGFQGLLRMLG